MKNSLNFKVGMIIGVGLILVILPLVFSQNGLFLNDAHASVQAVKIFADRCYAGAGGTDPFITTNTYDGIFCRDGSLSIPTDANTYKVVLTRFVTDDEGTLLVNGVNVYNDLNTCPCGPGSTSAVCRRTNSQAEVDACVLNEESRILNINIASFRKDGPTPVTVTVRDECGEFRGAWAEFEIYKQDVQPLSVSCSASPNPAQSGQPVTFASNVSGGTGAYSYAWSGECSGYSSTCSKSFSQSGAHSATVTIASGSQAKSASCSVSVSQPVSQNCPLTIYSHEQGTNVLINANIYFDNSLAGTKQVSLNITPGAHNLRADLAGYQAASQSVSCVNGETKRADLYLVKIIPTLSVSCSASPNPAQAGQNVTFSSNVSGGTGGYSYNWTGSCTGYSSNCVRNFSQGGNYNSTVAVTSGSQTKSANCSVFILAPTPTPTPTPRPTPTPTPTPRPTPTPTPVPQQCVINVNTLERNTNQLINANIRVDSNFIGVRQATKNVSAGSHQISADLSGYQSAFQQISCANSENKTYNLYLIKIISPNPLEVSCSANPDIVKPGQSVAFEAHATGWLGGYIYHWSGACSNDNQICNTSFQRSGIFAASVRVTSGSASKTTTCSVEVKNVPSPAPVPTPIPTPTPAPTPTPLSISCYASPNSIQTNQQVTFISNVSGGIGNYSYAWNGDCNSYYSTCYKTFYQQGAYTANVRVSSGSQSEIASCSVNVGQQYFCSNECSYAGQTRCVGDNQIQTCQYTYTGNNNCLSWVNTQTNNGSTACGYGNCASNQKPVWYCSGNAFQYNCVNDSSCGTTQNNLSCYGDDVYWFNQYGTRQNIYQNCGDSYCADYGSRYCFGNNVYQQRNCYNKGCSAGACYSNSNIDTKLAQICGSNQTCQYGQCVNKYIPPVTTYYKGCFEGNVYWYNNNGVKTSLYKYCNDNNSCTLDSCAGSACANELKCDGTTCAKGSDDYCKKCAHCGDGVLNCGETQCTCAQDFVSGQNLTISVLAKKSSPASDWRESLTVVPNDKVDLMMIVTNSSQTAADNVFVKSDISPNLVYENVLKVDANNFAGDIRDGIYIGQLPVNSSKTITFSARIVSGEGLSGNEADIKGVAKSGSIAIDDTVRFAVVSATGAAGIGFFAGIFTNWLFWFLLLLIVLLILFGRWVYSLWYKNRKLAEEVA